MTLISGGCFKELRAVGWLDNQILNYGADTDEDLIWQAAADDDLEDITNASDEESEDKHGGSKYRSAGNVVRWQQRLAAQLFKEYIAKHPTHPSEVFERQCRVVCFVFNKLHDEIMTRDPFLVQKPDCTKRLNGSSEIFHDLKIAAYGSGAGLTDR